MSKTTNQKIVSKTPKLRFPEFSGDWQEKKLGDILEYRNGTSHERAVTKNGKYFLISLNSIDIHGNLKPDMKRLSYTDNSLQKNDLIMVLSDVAHGDFLGLTDIIPNNLYVLNQRMASLRLKENNKTNIKFLRYIINFNQRYFKIQGQGSSQLNLSKSSVINFTISIPTKPEQTKIANFLSSLDNLIDTQTQKLELLKTYKKGLMQQLFPQAGEKLPKLRFPEFSGDWQEQRLEDIFYSKKGQGLSKSDIDKNGRNRCILYGELYTKYSETIDNVISHTNSNIGVKSKAGDLLIPCSTTTTNIDLANVTVINENDVLIGGDISILRFQKNGNSVFFAYYLTHRKKLDLAKYGQGSTIIHLYYNHFKKINLYVPTSIKEQTKIANFLSSLDNLINTQTQKLELLKTYKKGLLQQMFV